LRRDQATSSSKDLPYGLEKTRSPRRRAPRKDAEDEIPAPGRLESKSQPPFASYRARALVKVQDGCDNRCTFCVIPSVRGRSASASADDVVACVRNLSSHGYREIVLAGIHLSSWGEDLEPKASLTELLRRITVVEGLGRVRLSSLDPSGMDEPFIEYVTRNPKICRHFHLSLQHASERLLRKMGRAVGAGLDAYASILGCLRRLAPDAALGADIIVGFPEETEEDFAVLEDFLRLSPLTYFHVFSYSPRRGTAAAGRSQVPDSLKKARSQRLRRLSAEKSLRFRETFLGKDLEAVVIGEAARRRPEGQGGFGSPGNRLAATEVLTGNYIKVMVPSCLAAEREFVRVRIAEVTSWSTEGLVVEA